MALQDDINALCAEAKKQIEASKAALAKFVTAQQGGAVPVVDLSELTTLIAELKNVTTQVTDELGKVS